MRRSRGDVIGKAMLLGALLFWQWAAYAAAPVVAAGVRHAVALDAAGNLYAWGSDAMGQLGVGRVLRSHSPVPVALSAKLVQIASGNEFSLALDDAGQVWAWGSDLVGQLGDGGKSSRSIPVAIGTGYAAVAASGKLGVGLKTDGSVWTWGYAGTSSMAFSGTRNPVQLGAGFGRISAGYGIVLALKSDGSLWQWAGGATTPTQVAGTYVAMAAGQGWDSASSHSLAIGTDGKLWAWALGATTPTAVAASGSFSQVAVGYRNFLALKSDGELLQWTNGIAAAPATLGTGYRAIAAGLEFGMSHFSFAIKTDGTLWAWGSNYYGRLGDGTTTDRATPVQVGSGYAAIAAGLTHAVGLKSDGTALAWGDNSFGELGDGSNIRQPVPQRIGTGYSVVAAGQNHNLALKPDGSLWVWGDNSCGQLGGSGRFGIGGTLDPFLSQSSPVLLDSGYRAVAAGDDFSAAIKTDGSLWVWGAKPTSNSGFACTATPTSLGTGFVSVSAGGGHLLALKADGTLWAYGTNGSGELGDGTTTLRTQPVQVGTGYAAAAAGKWNSVGVKTDGSLWGWGAQWERCQVGAPTAACMAPAQLGNGFANVAAGWEHNLALKTDGSLWAWGGPNIAGELGDGSTAIRLDPVGIGGNYATVAAGRRFSLAVAHDGTVHSWGLNDEGQLGQGVYAEPHTPQLTINGEANGFLDLNEAVPNAITALLVPKFLAVARKVGGLESLSLSVDLRGLLDSATRAGGGYNVYVAAQAGAGGATWYQLSPTRGWSGLAWPMAEFMTGVALAAQTDSVVVELLDKTDVSGLVGSRIHVGYGSDADEMLRAGRYREVLTISAP